MKNVLVVFCLLSIVYCFTSCSSHKDENKNDETNTVDTTLRGLAGVIEKNPPVQDGDYVKKYPSGVIQMRGYYVNGRRNGQWLSFFENGNIQSEGSYKDGLRDGKATVYYENGKIYYEGYYKDGKEVGIWIFYDESGKTINEKVYGGLAR